MLPKQKYTFAGTLCTALLLLWALTTVYAADQQQKLADAIAREKTRHARFSDRWAVQVSGGPENAESLARRHGLTNRGQIGNLEGFYLLTNGGDAMREATKTLSDFAISTTAALAEDETVMFIEQQKVQVREKRGYVSPSDPGWKKQWSLENTGQTSGPEGLDLNVEPVWMQGITGSGVVVGFVDDGLEWTHDDLVNNYDASASYDFSWYDEDPTPDVNEEEPNSHGTSCAGEVAMGRNCSCGVGVAYGCRIGGLKLDFNYMTDSGEADALGHKDSYIHVYSNSWGPSDYGFIVEGPGPLLEQTLSNGAREGRNGKGSVYVWAAGNGGTYHDSCAADGYVQSIYTIAIGSADQKGRQADYDEACSAKMAVTFSYNSDTFPTEDDTWDAYDQIYTTTLGGKCTDDFTGTSASTPLVSGVMALVLQANPDLTWRDVQYLIVYTSNPDILTVDDLATNGAGLKFSHHFGFGAIDAEAMVTRARHWINVPEQHKMDIPALHFTRTVYHSDDITFTVRDSDIVLLEHVVLSLTIEIHSYGREYDYDSFYEELYYAYDVDEVYNWLQDPHPRRGDIKIELVSPSGTTSVLLPYRNYDFVNDVGYDNWPFMSVHFWGEKPVGEWTLHITYKSGSGHITIRNVVATLYGTEKTPSSIASIPSSCNPACARGCFGRGPHMCDSCSNLRLLSTLECVDKCPNGTHAFKKYCIADSDSDDAESTTCESSDQTNRAVAIGSAVAAVVLVTLIVTIIVIVAVRVYKRSKKQTRFQRLYNVTTISS